MLPCGFILLVERPSWRFLASRPNSENFKSIIFHYRESARCRCILSIILLFKCHVKLFACSAFLYMRSNLGIIEKYHNALAGDFLFILYCDLPHTRHSSKFSYSFGYRIQSLGQSFILSWSILIVHKIFSASYVRSGVYYPQEAYLSKVRVRP